MQNQKNRPANCRKEFDGNENLKKKQVYQFTNITIEKMWHVPYNIPFKE